MSKKRTYKNYTPAFKEEAVALITEQGYSVSQAAESLGIRTNQLYQWKQKLEQSKQDSLPGDAGQSLGILRLISATGSTHHRRGAVPVSHDEATI